MLKSSTFLLAFLCSFTYLGSSMYLTFSREPMCFTIEDQPGMEFKFFYEILIGKDEKKFVVEFTPLNPDAPAFKSTESKFNTTFSETAMKICFVSTNRQPHSATIQYYTHDTAHLMELALKSQVYELHTKLIDIGEVVKEIVKDEQFEETRQNYASSVISQQQNRIQNFAIVKLLSIVVVAGAQLYLLKAILNKQGQGYHPV